MEDLTRLIISHERIENIKNNNLELSKEESHYLNKVMRIKNGKEIFIGNGEGSLSVSYTHLTLPTTLQV